MKTTVKLVLRTSKKRKDGAVPVYLRVTANRKARFISTKIYILPKYWNERKQEVRATHELAPTLNVDLKRMIAEAVSESIDAKTAGDVKKAIKGADGSLTDYFQDFIDNLDKAGRYWDWKKYRVTLGKVTAVFGTSINFKDIDRDALVKWERYLRETCGNAPNTVRKELQRLRRIYRDAIKNGVLEPKDDPFLLYDPPRSKRTQRRKLSFDEINALASVSLEASSWLDISRDVFLFSFYAAGMRFGDVCQLTPANILGREQERIRIHYKMAKTGHPTTVPIPLTALQFVEKHEGDESDFLFPMLRGKDVSTDVKLKRRINSANVVVNKYLKQVAELAGIAPDGLSMHVARHSWADYARRKSGDLYAISKSLGHRSLQTTEVYLKSLDQQAQDDLADTLWS